MAIYSKWPRFLLLVPGAATVSLLSPLTTVRADGSTRPSAVKQLPQQVVEALEQAGFSDVQTLVVVQPQDEFSVLVQEPDKGTEFTLYETDQHPSVTVPNAGQVGEIDYEELIVIWRTSPATCVVCEAQNGSQVCWQQQC